MTISRVQAATTAALASISALSGCSGDTPGTPDMPITIEQLEARIASHAVLLMDRESFADTHVKLGEEQFQNANDLTRWAAVATVAQGERCDRLDMVSVSDRSTRENIVWFADCDNGARVFIEQSEAEAAKARFGTSG